MRAADDLALATAGLARDIDAISVSVEQAVTELRRLRALNAELVAALKDMRDAMAAMMRVVAMHESSIAEEFGREVSRCGIRNGFGVRAQEAIAKAEGRS